MKVNVTQPLKEYDGRDVVDHEKQPVPVRSVLLNALASFTGEADPSNPRMTSRMTTEDKQQRFAISTKLWAGKTVDLSLFEVDFIISCVDAAYDSPLICGRVREILKGEGQIVPTDKPDTRDDTPEEDKALGKSKTKTT